ncbi:MAG: Ig-like domain-containing protein [Clostridiales bacterium]|nr:Ig-like domain-containing protein [Clostridiales bacterium]
MKRQMRGLLTVLLLLAGIMMMSSAKMQVQAAARLNYSSITVKQGVTRKLKVKGTSAPVTWSSSNENIVTVNAKGKITTLKGGNAVITAKTANTVLRCKVYVVGFNKTSLTIAKGSTYTLKVKNGGSSKIWTSSDTSIATVSSSGKIKAKKKGKVVIKCRTRNRTIKCKVYVAKLNQTSITLTTGATKQLKVSNTGNAVKWSSSNSAVASVDKNGLVTAGESIGTAKITCKTGQAVLTCDVQVGIVTSMSSLPGSSKENRLEVTVQSYPGTKTYMVYNQGGSATSNQSTLFSKYMPYHGCAACTLTTVLTGYVTDFDADLGPAYTVETIEKEVLGSSWESNYAKYSDSTDDDKSMPLSLYGITKVLDYYNVSNEYVRSFSKTAAVDEITNHLETGNAVIIEVTSVGSDTTWTSGYHTMVLLGITDTGKAIVADSVNRSGFGDTQRIKYKTVSSLINYMFSCTNTTSTAAYFSGKASSGGYILVNPQE